MLVQFIRAAERAAQCAADLDLIFAHRLLPEHRVKRQDFKNVDRLEFQLFRRPFDGFLTKSSRIAPEWRAAP
jgi:hypothetical protein